MEERDYQKCANAHPVTFLIQIAFIGLNKLTNYRFFIQILQYFRKYVFINAEIENAKIEIEMQKQKCKNKNSNTN